MFNKLPPLKVKNITIKSVAQKLSEKTNKAYALVEDLEGNKATVWATKFDGSENLTYNEVVACKPGETVEIKYSEKTGDDGKVWTTIRFVNSVHKDGNYDKAPTREEFLNAQEPF